MDNDSLTAALVAGAIALIGKIVWDWMKNRNGHSGMSAIQKQLITLNEKMVKIETELEYIKEDLKEIKTRS